MALTISKDEIEDCVSMKDCIECLEKLFRYEGDKIARQPMRSFVTPDEDSVIFTMPALSEKLRRFSVKVVTEYKQNPVRFGLPVQGGITILLDAENSNLLALIDSAALTALRTGALVGLATKIISREDSRRVAVIGCGQQARKMLEAVCTVREVKSVRAYSRTFEHSRLFAQEMTRKLDGRIEIVECESRKSALQDSDIVLLATNSKEPVIAWKELKEGGIHVNSIGTLPDRRELDAETIRNCRIFVDFKDGVMKEAGDIIFALSSGAITESQIEADLPELVRGEKVGRRGSYENTLFKSVGFALLDVYASSLIYERVLSRRK
jgi:ornithine cyclodeaminase/alanine dehydrogenase-like protein (mu-crystallin family)